MMDDVGVLSPLRVGVAASGNTVSPTSTSRIDLLRARVHSRQQTVESIFKSRERRHDTEGDGSLEGESAETLPLHMQQPRSPPTLKEETKALKDQLGLIQADRERLRSELSVVQQKHHEKESTLQSEIMSFKYKYDVLRKEIELTNNDAYDDYDAHDDYDYGTFHTNHSNPKRPSRHVRRLSSPPRDNNYFSSLSSSSENDPSAANGAMQKLTRRVQAVQQEKRDVTSVQQLQRTVETLVANEQSYQNEILDLQAEVIRLNLHLELQIDDDDENNKTSAEWNDSEALAELRAQVDQLNRELQAERAKQYEEHYDDDDDEDSYYRDLKNTGPSTDIVWCSGCYDDYDDDDGVVSDTDVLPTPLVLRLFQDLEWCIECNNTDIDYGTLTTKEESQGDVVSSSSVDPCTNNCEEEKTRSSETLAQLEEAKIQNETLTAQLAALKLEMESTEMRIRITNDTTGRFQELTLSKSHELTLFDAMYNHDAVRSRRVRTWPMKIAQDVRNETCKIQCALLDQDNNNIVRIFDTDELKNVTTYQLFDMTSRSQDVIEFILQQCHKTEEVEEDMSVKEGEIKQILPKGMRIQIANQRSKVSKELFLPIAEDLNVFESIYNHSAVKVTVRKWPLEVIWQVNHKRSKIVCVLAGLETREIDDLRNMSLKDLYQLAPNPHGFITLALKCEKLEQQGVVPSPFAPTGFRQRGWLPAKTLATDLRVRLTNETTMRSKDLIVPISDTLTIYDAVYDSEVVCRANIRKWKSTYAEAVTKKLSEIACVQVDEKGKTMRTFTIDNLKEVTTEGLVEQSSNDGLLINLVLRCERTERARRDDIILRVVNDTTRRFKDLHIPYSEELTLYNAIYNNDALRAAQVRMWPKEILQAIKAESATIQCHLFDDQGNDEVQIFSVDKLKETPTKRIFDLLPNLQTLPQLVLKCQNIEKGELSLRVSNDITGRFKDVTVPISQDMTLHDVIYMNASIKFSYVRMWPSETVQAIKNKTGEIHCAMMGKQHEITFSIDDLKKTTTTQLVELSPAPNDLIKLVLRYRETGKMEEEDKKKEELNEIRLRITNATTGRFKDLTVPVSTELSLYRSIYSHRSVKAGRVRVWPSDVVHDLKQKAVAVECALLDSDGSPIYTFAVEGLRETSTKRLLELSPNPEDRISFVLRCETRAHTGSFASKLCEKFKSRGFRQRGWLPAESSRTDIRVRISNEITRRSKDLIVPVSDASTLYDTIYKHPEVKRGNVRKWSCTIVKEVKRFLSEIQCVQLDNEGGLIQAFSIKNMREATTKELLNQSSRSRDRINLVLRCLRTKEVNVDTENEGPNEGILTVLSSDSFEGNELKKVKETEEQKDSPEADTRLSFKPTGFRQRGWLPANSSMTDLRIRLTNEKTGRWKDLLVPISENLTLYDAVYNNQMVIRANIRKYPSAIVTKVKEKTCEIHAEMFLPRFGMVENGSAFTTDSIDDILFDDEGNAVRSLSIDDLYQTTTIEIFELLSRPKDLIKMVLRVKKVEAVDALENKLSSLEQKLLQAEDQARRGSELLVEKLKALDESTHWNHELTNELRELKADMSSAKASSPRNAMPMEAKPESELLKEKEGALEEANRWNQSLKQQLEQLHTEIEVLETSATNSIMPEYKSVLEDVIEEDDEEFSEDISFKPIGFRQRGWLSDQSSSMDMRLRITNETTQRWKDFVVAISEDLTLLEAVYSGAQSSDANDVFDKASKVQCVVWHDHGKDMRTFSVDELKQLSTKRFFELTSRRQDLLQVLLRCQETARKQVGDLESEVADIRLRNEALQNSMCVLSNELASSVEKHNRLQLKLDGIRQGQEGGLLFSSELFEI
jgi:hypothetical protein